MLKGVILKRTEVRTVLAPNTLTWYNRQSPSSEDLNHKEEAYSVSSLYLAYQNSRKQPYNTKQTIDTCQTRNEHPPSIVIWLPFKFTNLILLLYFRYLLWQTGKPPSRPEKWLMGSKTNVITPLERDSLGCYRSDWASLCRFRSQVWTSFSFSGTKHSQVGEDWQQCFSNAASLFFLQMLLSLLVSCLFFVTLLSEAQSLAWKHPPHLKPTFHITRPQFSLVMVFTTKSNSC